jgi:DNA (cytosine-5)-methyltransferase 1
MKGDPKPPYEVPSMKEVNSLPSNGLKVASLFSGGGGSSVGYKMDGWEVIWANEFVPSAAETYAVNNPKTYLNTSDIRSITPAQLLDEAQVLKGELELLDGSPPCASFSTAGKRDKHWGKVKKYSDVTQRTDDLFFEFARILEGVQPKVFVAENVSGLIKGKAKGYFIEILARLKDCGYRVRCKVLDAKWLGVPQSRQRTIFIGVREDLQMNPVHPSPLPYFYSVRDAIPWIKKIKHLPVEKETDITKYCTGKEWEKLTPGKQSEKYFNLVRADPHKPSPAICASHGTQSIASVTHPYEKRKFSIQELKLICGFPADYILKGTFSQQYERLGRAVPPLMMHKIARTVRTSIFCK